LDRRLAHAACRSVAGTGVQPLVTVSRCFIIGSVLAGPVNRLSSPFSP